MRIALGQINPTVGDFEGNLAKITAYSKAAQAKGCDLVMFPELTLCGYPPEDLLLNRSFVEANRTYLKKLISRDGGIIIVCGYAGSTGREVYNSAAVIQGRKLMMSYNKVALPNYGVFDEKRYFHPGTEMPLLRLRNTLIGINICEDIWICPGISEQQAAFGARVILNISASPYHMHKAEERIEMLRDRALRNHAFVFYCNMVGGQDELIFDGASLVIDPHGKVIARAELFQEQLLIVDIPEARTANELTFELIERAAKNRDQQFPIKYAELGSAKRKAASRKIAAKVATKISLEEEVYRALALATRDYVTKNGFKQVVIGMSGGIDSALTAAVAVDSLGKENVHLIFMPSLFTSELSHHAASRQAKLLGVAMTDLPIVDLFDDYAALLNPALGDCTSGLTGENLQARIRGNLLMAYSNKFGALVLNTSNKSESAVGYTTLYGDMVGGFAVLEDIPKTLVYRIAKHLNRSLKREVIAREIIKRPPTAELKDDQLDTDSLPPYEILDEILRLYVELDTDEQEIVAAGFDAAIVRRVIRMVRSSEYKRRQSAPGARITPRSFGKDRRWPITNKF
ncbi:MAG: NAD+ synthase [Candidatus Zixiibacteriota bacterium]